MTKKTLLQLAELAATPVILLFLGFLLLLKPDVAPVLASRILGWLCIAAAVLVFAESLVDTFHKTAKILIALAALALGLWVLRNPLAVLTTVTKLAGILICVNACRDIHRAKQLGLSMTWAVMAAVAGAVFVFMPLTASRLILRLCGGAIAAVGGLMLWFRLRQGKRLNPPDDHGKVIDAL